MACGCDINNTVTRAVSAKLVSTITDKGGAFRDYYAGTVRVRDGVMLLGADAAELKNKAGKTIADAGAVFVLRKGTDGKYVAYSEHSPDELPAKARFSRGLAIDGGGDLFLVGTGDINAKAGAAWVYLRDDTKAGKPYEQVAKIAPKDLAAGHQFGRRIAVDARIAVIGAYGYDKPALDNGAVYVFDLKDLKSGPKQEAILTEPNLAGGRLGHAVDILDGRIAAGAPRSKAAGTQAGAAYVYQRVAGQWQREAVLMAGDPGTGDNFGWELKLGRGAVNLLVGAPDADGNVGAAYLFRRDLGGKWRQAAKLVPKGARYGDDVGFAVAIHDAGVLAVGGYKHDAAGSNRGAAWLFARDHSGAYVEVQKFVPPGGGVARYGYDLAIGGDDLVIGDWGAKNYFGVGYAFAISAPTLCSAKGVCACKPGYGGARCDAVTDPCAIPGHCSDGDPCTADTCDKTKGCVYQPGNDNASCDDGQACTITGRCKQGKCPPGPTKDCGDSNPCTTDSCDPDKGCVYAARTGACDDGSVCTQKTACKSGVCTGGTTTTCDDGLSCNVDYCDSIKGCQHVGNLCNDGDPCTVDTCAKAKGGCHHTVGNDGASCDDGDKCSESDVCKAGTCKGTPKTCKYKHNCRTGACNPKTGSCDFTPANASAVCLVDGRCSGGDCECPPGKYPGVGKCEACGCNTTNTVPRVQPFLDHRFTGPGGAFARQQVAIAADMLYVGDSNYSKKAKDAGYVVTYKRNTTTRRWSKVKEVLPTQSIADSRFGFAVGASATHVVVGAPTMTVGGKTKAGNAYIYKRSGDNLTLQTVARSAKPEKDAHCGLHVKTFGDHVGIVCSGANGRRGSVLIYTRKGDSWTRSAEIAPASLDPLTFFVNLGLPGSYGAAMAKDVFFVAGVSKNKRRVYVFERVAPSDNWKLSAELSGTDSMGTTISASGTFVAMLATVKGPFGNKKTKAALVFSRKSIGSWSQAATIYAPEEVGANFGGGIALSGDRLFVGASSTTVAGVEGAGTITSYQRAQPGAWLQSKVSKPSKPVKFGSYGTHIGVDGDTILVMDDPPHGGTKHFESLTAQLAYACNAFGACNCKQGFGGDKCDKKL